MEKKINIILTSDNEELSKGLVILESDLGISVSGQADGRTVTVTPVKTEEMLLKVEMKDNKAVITYHEKAHFYRGVGLLSEHIGYGENEFSVTENPRFTLNGGMYDIAQANAVINVENVKRILRKEAVMGLNMFMLYCEDNYEIDGYPYFGYMRGRYSKAEMREIDDYAYTLGIELIPCIQTLAHLQDALRWPAYNGMRMDKDTLFVGEEKVYEFIEEMIKSASECVRTKRIHIGMDEAGHLGEGEYLRKHGHRRRFDIMLEHLDRVKGICTKLGLKPMIWSDMFFSTANNGGSYYNKDIVIPQDVLDSYPKDVQLVYWDYYRADKDFYRTYIDRHYEFGTKPVFAGGVHTWYSIAPWVYSSIEYTDAALQVCAEKNIDEVICTIWGDDNTAAHIYTTLQGLQLFAECSFNGAYNEKEFAKRFKFCTGIDYNDFMDLGTLECLPNFHTNNHPHYTTSKSFLWTDVLLGLNDNYFEGQCEIVEEHYKVWAKKYGEYAERNEEFKNMFLYYKHVAEVLEYKATIGNRLMNAYKDKTKEALKLMLPRLEELRTRTKALIDFYRDDWYATNKPFGWEIFDFRFGAIVARTESAISRVTKYINGELDEIEELAYPRVDRLYTSGYGFLVSASRISYVPS
ncbi:MAG: beta-N-acetylhexosaminidase [Ruminococcaceae bacterium]|nr:beta-N-acetylhexosaminidase [Oscillospiraceae bacterium]